MKNPFRTSSGFYPAFIVARKSRFVFGAGKPRQLRLWPNAARPARLLNQRPRAFGGLALILAGLMLAPSCRGKLSLAGSVWARVDGQPIFRRQVERIFKERMAAGDSAADPEEADNFKLDILNELINRQVLLNHARHSRITVSEAQVDTRLAQLESPYSPQEFGQKLRQQGMTLAEFRKAIRTDLAIHELINREINSRVSVSQAEIAAYYQRNKSSFDVPETEYHLAQI